MLLKFLRLQTNYQYYSVRLLYYKKDIVNNERLSTTDNIKFTPVYKFPYIRILSVLNRLKLYQTALTLTTAPVVLILSGMDLVGKDVAVSTLFLGLSGTILLYSLGIWSSKFIGIVYLSEDESLVKVSSIDFWGKRKDDIIPINDVVPFSDLPITTTDALYLRFTQFSKPDYLKINLKFGVILNKNSFDKIFL